MLTSRARLGDADWRFTFPARARRDGAIALVLFMTYGESRSGQLASTHPGGWLRATRRGSSITASPDGTSGRLWLSER